MAVPAFAQQEKGHKGIIDKQDIVSILAKDNSDEEIYIDGYIINGTDIIDIIGEHPQLPIRIKNSIIENGLNIHNHSQINNEIKVLDSEIQYFEKIGNGFKLSVNAGNVTFHNKIIFDSVKFNNKVSFRSAVFKNTASFSSCIFMDKAEFNLASFSGRVQFPETVFAKADFSSASFEKLSYFKDAVFLDFLKIGDAKFNGYADFRDTGIRKLDFKAVSPNIITSPMDFRNAKISEAHFQDIIFEQDVDFSDVKFGAGEQEFTRFIGPLDLMEQYNKKSDYSLLFRYVTFKSNADFIRTEFLCDTGLEMVKFRSNANFKDAVLKHADIRNKFWFAYIDFNKLIIKWDQLPRPDDIIKFSENRVKSFLEKKDNINLENIPARNIVKNRKPDHLKNLSDFFKSLDANFRAGKQLSDANKAYYYMKELNLHGARAGEEVPEWRDIKAWLMAEGERIVWGIPCGYGTKIGRITAWIVFFHLLFTYIYYKKGQLTDLRKSDKDCIEDLDSEPGYEPSYKSGQTVPEPGLDHEKMTRLKMASRLSLAVLLKVESRSVGISGKICGINSKAVERFERWLGFYLVFCLLITSSNTFPLINRLLEGVF